MTTLRHRQASVCRPGDRRTVTRPTVRFAEPGDLDVPDRQPGHTSGKILPLRQDDEVRARRTRPLASGDRSLEVPQPLGELGIGDGGEGGVGVSHRHRPVS